MDKTATAPPPPPTDNASTACWHPCIPLSSSLEAKQSDKLSVVLQASKQAGEKERKKETFFRDRQQKRMSCTSAVRTKEGSRTHNYITDRPKSESVTKKAKSGTVAYTVYNNNNNNTYTFTTYTLLETEREREREEKRNVSFLFLWSSTKSLLYVKESFPLLPKERRAWLSPAVMMSVMIFMWSRLSASFSGQSPVESVVERSYFHRAYEIWRRRGRRREGNGKGAAFWLDDDLISSQRGRNNSQPSVSGGQPAGVMEFITDTKFQVKKNSTFFSLSLFLPAFFSSPLMHAPSSPVHGIDGWRSPPPWNL